MCRNPVLFQFYSETARCSDLLNVSLWVTLWVWAAGAIDEGLLRKFQRWKVLLGWQTRDNGWRERSAVCQGLTWTHQPKTKEVLWVDISRTSRDRCTQEFGSVSVSQNKENVCRDWRRIYSLPYVLATVSGIKHSCIKVVQLFYRFLRTWIFFKCVSGSRHTDATRDGGTWRPQIHSDPIRPPHFPYVTL